jgi:hypothetical protein
MNEYIKTAQAIAELPKEAGCGDWPFVLVNEFRKLSIMRIEAYCDGNGDGKAFSHWLTVAAFSKWCAAKWLERAGVTIRDAGLEIEFYLDDDRIHWCYGIPTNLDYMKVILAIGQRAFGRLILLIQLESKRNLWNEEVHKFVSYLKNKDVEKARDFVAKGRVKIMNPEIVSIIKFSLHWDYTEEQRQPWLEAWERGQNINQAE